MNGAMRKIVILVGSLSLLALPLVASADEGGGEEDPAPPDDSQLVYHYDSNVLLFGFFSPETDPEACTPAESAVDGAADGSEGTTDDGGAATDGAVGEATPVLSEGCSSLTIEGSVGKVNHGSFLSLFSRDFKASFEGDTPFGHYVREFAKSYLGKTDKVGKAEKADKGSDDEDGSETDGDDGGSGKPDKTPNGNNGNGHGKGKKGD